MSMNKQISTGIKSALVASILAIGGMAATAGTASADRLHYDSRGGFSFHIGGPRYRGERYYGSRRYRRAQRCHPRRALRKARHRGIRRAHILRVSRRGVLVGGRKWGDRVVIGFANRHRCPVRFIDHR